MVLTFPHDKVRLHTIGRAADGQVISNMASIEGSHRARKGISSILIVHLIGLAVQRYAVGVLVDFSYVWRIFVFS